MARKGVIPLKSIITMQNVKKEFKETTALRNLSFHVEEGEVFGFLGPSGAGKTTAIKILTAQLRQTAGEVRVFGKEFFKEKKDIMGQIGVLSDSSGIYERLSVYENLEIFARIHGVGKNEIMEVLERVGMADQMKKEAKKLSRGMKQRLMLARTVLHKPRLLFLDEPTSSLDPGITQEIHHLLRKLNQEGTTIFLTTHNMDEADKLCARVAFLNSGEIVELGKPDDLKLKYAGDMVKVVLDNEAEPVFVTNNADGGLKIGEWMKEGRVRAIHSQEPNLEKIFLGITGREL